ncbi:MAG: folate-binding protein [Pseudomonadota bacterium]|nr:folate-binding protein [Pseudomonadota bacterium]
MTMHSPNRPATDDARTTEKRGSDTPAAGRLPHFGLLRFAGPDALSFLQGQVSNDTRRLGDGAPLLAAYSTPQGRVAAVLHLLPHSSGVIALLPREMVLPTLERLRKYVLRAKLSIEDLSGQFAVVGGHGVDPFAAAHLPVPERAPGYAERNGVGVARVGAEANRLWAIGSIQDLSRCGLYGLPQEAERLAAIELEWRLADIRAGLPQVYAATREMFVAQMLNLDLIDGISFTKGCFTGQEIIARTQHLGRIKRRLFRLRLPADTWAIGQAVHLRDGRSGRLTELAQAGTEFEALAVLNLETGSGGANTPGPGGGGAAAGAASHDAFDSASTPTTLIDATELPLPYALGGA